MSTHPRIPLRPLPPTPWNNIAIREYAVDQGAILDALLAQNNIHAMVARHGFCLSLTLDWVSRTLAGRLPSASTYANATSEGMKACVAAHVTGYFAFATGHRQIDGIARSLGLTPNIVASGSALVPYGIMGAPAVVAGAVLKNKDRCRQGVGYLHFDLAEGAHAIGFRMLTGTFRFFDPNFGSYVTHDQVSFSKALQGLLADVYPSVRSYQIHDFAQSLML